MNLVNELQISAEQDDVLVVLRKTKRLASKLDRRDISEWLQAELNGYEHGQALPAYRVVDAMLAFNINNAVTPGFGFLTGSISPLPCVRVLRIPIVEPISTLVPVINDLKSSTNCLYRSTEEGSASREVIRSHIAEINGIFAQPVMFLLHPDPSQIRAIPEKIKDKVLDWACELEVAGVLGDGSSFTDKEKEAAHSITFNFSHCTIEQLTNLGTNRKG
jgi:AbiTii